MEQREVVALMTVVGTPTGGDATVDRRPFGLALTLEELSALPILLGGACPVAADLGLAQVGDIDDPVFDVGFRSLLVRGLVATKGDDVGLVEELRVLGSLLVGTEEAWVLTVESAKEIESFAFLRAGDLAVVLVPGPIGIYSYRPIAANLPREIVGLLASVETEELAPVDDAVLVGVAVRVYPRAAQPVAVRVVKSGTLVRLEGGEWSAVSPDDLVSDLAKF